MEIYVDDATSLFDAYVTLSNSGGGGTILLSGNFPWDETVSLSGGGSNPVHITSANENDPVGIGRITLNSVDNVKVSNVHIDSSVTNIDVPFYQGDVDIRNSSDILFDNITYTSNGSMLYDPAAGGAGDGGRMVVVDDSNDIAFTNSVGSRYFQGFTLTDSTGLTVENVELFGIQGDGIKMSEVTDVLIKDNYLHDFAASPNDSFHSDFIQLHSGGPTTVASSDITITGNILDTGNGNSIQGIWMRNEAYDATGNNNLLYTGIEVSDNVIYTGSANGIGVGASIGTEVTGNTLLWNSEAVTLKSTGNTSYEPSIRISNNARDVQIENNISPKYVLGTSSSVSLSGNVTVEYSASHPDFVGNHFVNANGGDVGPEGWVLLDSSSWVGKGAASTQPGGSRPYIMGTEFDDVLTGTEYNDTIFSGDGNDMLLGYEGSDIFHAGRGADTVDGGDGYDFISYHQSSNAILVDLRYQSLNTGEASGDVLVSVEGIAGSQFADSLRGDDAANQIDGLGGNDLIFGRSGTDYINGGAGNDTIVGGSHGDTIVGGSGEDRTSYWNSPTEVLADLAFPELNQGDADGDVFLEIENVQGTHFSDDLRGDHLPNKIWGGHGDDVLHGRSGNDTLFGQAGNDLLLPGAGADIVHGGEGIDRVAYWTSSEGVLIDLVEPARNTNHAYGDVFVSIEEVQGTGKSDQIFGSETDDILIGGPGDDLLEGRDGIDQLFGGTGRDTFVFSEGTNSIFDFEIGSDYIGIRENEASFSRDELAIEYLGSSIKLSMADQSLTILGGTPNFDVDEHLIFLI